MYYEIDFAGLEAIHKTSDKTKWGLSLPLDCDNFWDYIEDGVKDLVKVLIDKGYRTIGSCEGHTDGRFDRFEIYVRVGFKEDEANKKVELQNALNRAKNIGIKFVTLDAKPYDNTYINELYPTGLYIMVTHNPGQRDISAILSNYNDLVVFLQNNL